MKDLLRQTLVFSSKTLALLILVTIFTAFGVFVIFEPAISKLNRAQDQQISVDGYAKKDVTPDMAFINISAIFTGTNAGDLKKEADKALTQTVTDIKSLSSSQIDEKNIKTTYTVTPKYDKDYQNIIGYTVNPTLNVKTSDFSAVDKVITAAENNKLNLVNSVYFTLDDPVKAKDELRNEAIAAAKAKAEQLAKETGIRLGNIINISENNYQPYAYDRNNLMLANSVTKEANVGTPDAQTENTFNPGQTEISLTVYLTYSVY